MLWFAERDQLALTEHILQKLAEGGGIEPEQAPVADNAAPDRGVPAGVAADEQQPVMLLGAP